MTMDVETAVRRRYSEAIRDGDRALCCPVTYDPKYLEVIPKEILQRDYGCGDPSRFVREGDTVLDLGCGAGKICYIAAQIAGPRGRVLGIDFNTEMLALAGKHRPAIVRRLGYDNVVFHRARIQDLCLSLDEVDCYLRAHPVRDASGWAELESFTARLRVSAPLVPDESVDLALSNCVLNLVPDPQKPALFSELYRVLRRGGRAAICDIVSDEDVPAALKQDPQLWSGCLAGAMREDRFLAAFERAGFYGVQIETYTGRPWRTLKGIEFRAVTVTAHKGKEGPCVERRQAVIYKGPWKEVRDDDGHRFRRGHRVAVCDKTYQILTRPPYAHEVIPVPPLKEVPLSAAPPFACNGTVLRDPRETKGKRYRKTLAAANGACGPECC